MTDLKEVSKEITHPYLQKIVQGIAPEAIHAIQKVHNDLVSAYYKGEGINFVRLFPFAEDVEGLENIDYLIKYFTQSGWEIERVGVSPQKEEDVILIHPQEWALKRKGESSCYMQSSPYSIVTEAIRLREEDNLIQHVVQEISNTYLQLIMKQESDNALISVPLGRIVYQDRPCVEFLKGPQNKYLRIRIESAFDENFDVEFVEEGSLTFEIQQKSEARKDQALRELVQRCLNAVLVKAAMQMPTPYSFNLSSVKSNEENLGIKLMTSSTGLRMFLDALGMFFTLKKEKVRNPKVLDVMDLRIKLKPKKKKFIFA